MTITNFRSQSNVDLYIFFKSCKYRINAIILQKYLVSNEFDYIISKLFMGLLIASKVSYWCAAYDKIIDNLFILILE